MSTQNEKIWDQLVRNDVLCSQPKMDLTPETAKAYLSRIALYGESAAGKQVLCLAGGGGQQSIGFALLGAQVTVVDFSSEQLKKDKLAAEKLGQEIRICKADMRDLSMFESEEFDWIYQPYSINYIPDITPVLEEVSRILKPGGLYDLMLHNPFVHGTWKDGCWGSEWKKAELWEEKGYPIWQPYQEGSPIHTSDPHWNFTNQHQENVRIPSPQEYRHTLSTLLNGLISRRLDLVHFQEEVGSAADSEPGTWEHYKSCAPPWLYVLSRKRGPGA